MKVTPTKNKFGKYKPGDEFEFPDKAAKIFIRIGRLAAVAPREPFYQTRDMRPAPDAVVVVERAPEAIEEVEATDASPVEATADAPYGYKADGTPRKRPGRAAAAE